MTLPLDPLLAAITPTLDHDGAPRPVGPKQVHRVLGVGHKRLARWRRDGLTIDEADDMAGRLRVHPTELWGDGYYLEVAAVEHESDQASQLPACDAEGCDAPVEPSARGQHRRYCTKRCANRERMRRYRARHEHAREADRRRSAEYVAAYKDYVRARQRRYDAARRAERADEINAQRRARYAARRAA